MIDYFALLNQPRAPWLDPTQLKHAYHRKTLQAHPDTAGPGATDKTFAEINDAYQVLQDPKRRLHHLLELEGHAPASTERSVPQELQDLFPLLGALTQRANLLLEKQRTASNALSRSLLKAQILEVEKETQALREKIHNLSDASLGQLRRISSDWERDRAAQMVALSNLYFKFAYLARWSAQLDEMAFQLSSS
jgi:curved DNA-binding protein CbpA